MDSLHYTTQKVVAAIAKAHVEGRSRQGAPELSCGQSALTGGSQGIHGELKLIVVEILLELSHELAACRGSRGQLTARLGQVLPSDAPTPAKIIRCHETGLSD